MQEFRMRSVMGTFPRQDKAQSALKELKKEGFLEGQVDEVSWRQDELGDIRNQPWPISLTGRTDDDNRGFAAMDPSISGFAKGGEELIHGEHRYLLTQPLELKQDADKAAEIIRKHGGNVDSGGPR